MTTATHERLLTAEEFMNLPDPEDGSQQELVRGVVVTMPAPKPPHGYTCSQVSGRLWQFCEASRLGFFVGNDTGVITERGPDTVRGPDVAYWSFARQPTVPDGYFEVAPDLAVEMLSRVTGASKWRRRSTNTSRPGPSSSGSLTRWTER
jgi:Uma2 family endonuclease